jgi:hypothetical protein
MSAIEVTHERLRVESDGLGEVGDGSISITPGRIGLTTLTTSGVEMGLLRVESDGLGEVGNRLVVLAAAGSIEAPLVELSRRLSRRLRGQGHRDREHHRHQPSGGPSSVGGHEVVSW